MTGFVEQFPTDNQAPALARRALDAGLPEDVLAGVGATLRLLVSELVTNSVRHAATSGGGEVRLGVTVRRRVIRVEVRDRGAGFERTAPVPKGADGGFGLFLVEKMASRWGVDRKDGTSVWFELDLEPARR